MAKVSKDKLIEEGELHAVEHIQDTIIKCSIMSRCNAPICPLDKNRDKAIWYPGEEICRSSKFSHLQWIKNQKKIAKRAKDKNRYFTLNMLDKHIIIKTGIIGLDPNRSMTAQEKRWLAEHPEMSKERVAQLRSMGKGLYNKRRVSISPNEI